MKILHVVTGADLSQGLLLMQNSSKKFNFFFYVEMGHDFTQG